MGRQIDPNTAYRVGIHKNNGYLYACTQPGYLDQKTGKYKHKHYQWGKIDENLKFYPGPRYLLATLEERRKLIFPSNWDLSETTKYNTVSVSPPREIGIKDLNLLYGDVWLCERVSEITYIREDVFQVLNANVWMTDIVMTLAIYLECGRESFNNLPEYQQFSKYPTSVLLTEKIITTVTQSITEEQKMALFRLRMARIPAGSFCAVDSTTRYAYGEKLPDVVVGKSKEKIKRPQTVELVVYSLDAHAPVYSRTFPGNMPDSRTLNLIIDEIESLGAKDIVLITDRGYENTRNINLCIGRSQKLVTATKLIHAPILKRIREIGEFGHSPDGDKMNYDWRENLCYRQYDIGPGFKDAADAVGSACKARLNLYLDPDERSRELSSLKISVEAEREALEETRRKGYDLDTDSQNAVKYEFFKLDRDPATNTLKGFTLNEKKVNRKKLLAGFFANTTVGLDMGAIEAHQHYNLRDEQEKYFSRMKSLMGVKCQRVWSDESKQGREFILFVAQVIGSYISHIRKTKLDIKEFPSSIKVLNTMKNIRYIEHPGSVPCLTPFVGKQVTICEAFGFKIPEGSAPQYSIKKTDENSTPCGKVHVSPDS